MPDITSGSQVYGTDFPPSAFDQEWSNILNITTTSYIVGSPEVGVTVTAPTSGRVLVCIGAGMRNNAANNDRALVSFRVFEDSSNGVEFLEEDDRNGIKSCGISESQDFRYVGNMTLVEDLEPGQQYYFQVMHRSLGGNGTSDISARDILVIPQP